VYRDERRKGYAAEQFPRSGLRWRAVRELSKTRNEVRHTSSSQQKRSGLVPTQLQSIHWTLPCRTLNHQVERILNEAGVAVAWHECWFRVQRPRQSTRPQRRHQRERSPGTCDRARDRSPVAGNEPACNRWTDACVLVDVDLRRNTVADWAFSADQAYAIRQAANHVKP
jgi:hypothetical protein